MELSESADFPTADRSVLKSQEGAELAAGREVHFVNNEGDVPRLLRSAIL